MSLSVTPQEALCSLCGELERLRRCGGRDAGWACGASDPEFDFVTDLQLMFPSSLSRSFQSLPNPRRLAGARRLFFL